MLLFRKLNDLLIAAVHIGAMRRDGRDDSRVCAGSLVEQNAERRGQSIALKWKDRSFTWQQVNVEANRVAAYALAQGLRAGDCVALCLENCPEALFIVAGLNKCGIVAALINPQLSGSPLAHALGQCKARIVVAEHETLVAVAEACHQAFERLPLLLWIGEREDTLPESPVPALAAVLPPHADNPARTGEQRGRDVMMYLFTSGTTGLPKAAIIRNRRFVRMAHGFAGGLMQARETDVIYLTLPFYHATGAIAAWGTSLVSGAALAMRRRFSATKFWDDCVFFNATIVNYIGELCRYLLAAPPHPLERSHALRLAVGAGLRADVWRSFQARFAVPRIVEFYGSTEGNVGLVNLSGRPGMIGRLLPGQRVVQVNALTGSPLRSDAGHLLVARAGQKGLLVGRISGRAPFDGYLERERNQDKVFLNAFGDGVDWFNTGDLVEVHPGRWVSFADRLGDTYRWKGENISTLEVADLLAASPQVMEANVYGVAVPNADGRAGMAALVTGPDFSVDAFSRDVQQRVPVHMRPAFIRLQSHMTTTASLKHIKTVVREEGADPSVVDDPVFYLGAADGEYRLLDTATWERICSGEVRL